MIKTALKLTTAATSNVITTVEAKTHLKVDYADTTENTFIDSLIVAAQRMVEAYTNLSLSDTVYTFQLTGFPLGGITLPVSPLKTLTSIKYYDSTNTEQTWASSNYFYSISENPITIRYVDSYPTTYEDRFDAVNVLFTAGLTSPATVPPPLIASIKLLLTDLYENRTDAPREKFTAWKSLAYPYRVFHKTTDNR